LPQNINAFERRWLFDQTTVEDADGPDGWYLIALDLVDFERDAASEDLEPLAFGLRNKDVDGRALWKVHGPEVMKWFAKHRPGVTPKCAARFGVDGNLVRAGRQVSFDELTDKEAERCRQLRLASEGGEVPRDEEP
jgi:hypothetical protein